MADHEHNKDARRPSPSSRLFPQAQHYLPAQSEDSDTDGHLNSTKNWQTEFGIRFEPRLRVEPGELIHIETLDCFQGKVHPTTEMTPLLCRPLGEVDHVEEKAVKKDDRNNNVYYDPYEALERMTRDEFNPVTGPIHVSGAMPGDILAVTLLDIRPKDGGCGVACCSPHSGQLSRLVTRQHIQFFDLEWVDEAPKDDSNGYNREPKLMVTMRDDNGNIRVDDNDNPSVPPRLPKVAPISFAASPMLGVVGVAPAGPVSVSTMPGGKHGGNLDNQANGIGSTIYLTVNHPGGLLSIGDMHAAQGDGEICGNGVEVAGDVLLTCRLLKRDDVYGISTASRDRDENSNAKKTGEEATLWPTLEYPVTETATHWITHGVVTENIPETTIVACEEAAKLLVGQWGFTMEQAFCFLSVQGNLGHCQSCHPDRGTQIAKMSVPKLSACPRPFRTLLGEEDASTNNV